MSNNTTETRTVSFGTIEIRSHTIVLGTNPASLYGPAIELGWEYFISLPPTDIELYEQKRPSANRRKLKQLYLYLPTRVYRLKNLGYTKEEIAAAVAEKDVIIRHRQRSNFFMNPLFILQQERKSSRRTKKVQRAVRNLSRKQSLSDIYSGWRLPFSAFVF